jgi:hypothetical protein
MNGWEREIMEALVRGIRRQAEQDFIQCLKTTKLLLAVLWQEETIAESAEGEYAELEELT